MKKINMIQSKNVYVLLELYICSVIIIERNYVSNVRDKSNKI